MRTLALCICLLSHWHFTSLSAQGWSRFDSEEGRFSVLFPGAPEIEILPGSFMRSNSVIHAYVDDDAKITLGVTYFDMDPMLLTGYKENKEVFLKAFWANNRPINRYATLISESFVRLNGHQGRKMKYQSINNAEVLQENITYFVDGRVYDIMAIYYANETNRAAKEKFIRSLRLH